MLVRAGEWENSAFFPTSPTLHILSMAVPKLVVIIFGFLLGSNYIMKEYNSEGRWSFNYRKLLILGVLPIVVILFLGVFQNLFNLNLDRFNTDMIVTLALILFGYYFSQSFYKVKS